MKIATFTKTETGTFTGQIQTLTLNVGITLTPNEDKANDRAPDYRITVTDTGAECGAAWNETSKEGNKPYISLKIDDPALPETTWSNLVKDDDETYALYWDRRKPKTKSSDQEIL